MRGVQQEHFVLIRPRGVVQVELKFDTFDFSLSRFVTVRDFQTLARTAFESDENYFYAL
jgi:hypothetical protein